MITVLLAANVTVGPLSAQEPNKKSAKAAKGTKEISNPTRWEATIQKFEASDASMPPPKNAVLLVGGSNARRWTDVSDYFPQHQVINRGFGGAQMADVLHYADRIVLPYAPAIILLNAGGNDLNAGKTPEQICELIRAFIAKVHSALPNTRIFCLGVPPVQRTRAAPELLASIRGVNKLIEESIGKEKNVEFIDLVPTFLDDQGQSSPAFFVEDGTHFSPKGYAAVANLLRSKF